MAGPVILPISFSQESSSGRPSFGHMTGSAAPPTSRRLPHSPCPPAHRTQKALAERRPGSASNPVGERVHSRARVPGCRPPASSAPPRPALAPPSARPVPCLEVAVSASRCSESGPSVSVKLQPSPPADTSPTGTPPASVPAQAPLCPARRRTAKPPSPRPKEPTAAANSARRARWEMRRVTLWKCAHTSMLMKLKG